MKHKAVRSRFLLLKVKNKLSCIVMWRLTIGTIRVILAKIVYVE